MRRYKNIIILVLLLTYTFVLPAQNRSELERQRMRIIDKIEFTTSILKQTENDKSKVLDYLLSLKNQIANRKEIINNLRAQIQRLNTDITQKQKTLDSLVIAKNRIEKKFYSVIRKSYIQELTKNGFLFLLSASDWEDFMDRKRYLRQYNKYIHQKLAQIHEQKNIIDNTLDDINKDKAEIEKLLQNEQENINKLDEEKKKKDAVLRKLKREERKLMKLLKKQKKQREVFNRNIENIILNQLTDKEDIKMRDKNEGISTSFAANKSLLPMPVDNGYISSHFGKHKHPTIKGVYIFNDGIDIRTYPFTKVKAVFDGKVVGLMHISGYNWMIILKHGDYYTVYSKLASVTVSKGDQVKKGTILGNIGENGQFHFGIWKNKNKLDPEKWLKL